MLPFRMTQLAPSLFNCLLVDMSMKNELTNGFALMANVGVDGVWGPVQTYTIELYPTAVRYIRI